MPARARNLRTIVPANVPVVGDTKSGKMHRDWYRILNDINDSLIDPNFSWVRSCTLATTEELTVTYDNGTNGIGATLTFPSPGAPPLIDGFSILGNEGYRILVKDQATNIQNGIYEVVRVPNTSSDLFLRRTTDYDNNGETSRINRADSIVIEKGDANGSTLWIQDYFNTDDPNLAKHKVGIDKMTFTRFTSFITLTTGDPVTTPPTYNVNQNTFAYTATGLYLKVGTAIGSWIKLSGTTGVKSFTNIAVSGQSDIVADSVSDTLTVVAGSGITLTTNASTDTLTITNSSSVTPAALTKVDDTNVTLTLGGTPTTALLQAASITAGWTGTLSKARGGNGVATQPGFAAYNSSTTTCTAATSTKIALQTEEYDTDGCFDSTTNYRFTPTIAGKYIVSFSVFWSSANLVAGTQYNAILYKNGSPLKYGTLSNVVGTNGNSVGSYLVDMNGTTDYIELYGFNGNAVNSIATNADALVTFMSAGWVCP